jgi:glycosyltransferase involved in cell wall biosynthesis
LNNSSLPRIRVALPVLDESRRIPRLVRCIRSQTFRNFDLTVCVNQPDDWWQADERKKICEDNRQSMEYLKEISGFEISVIDRSSRGNGWKGKRHGVGWARKVAMDAINKNAGESDIILSMDADVEFSPHYFQTVAENFSHNLHAVGMAVPYFHEPVDDPNAYRAILRYEIYMRYYSLNLWRIGSPYTFTALGSAMACPVWAYRAVGGMTPRLSGEDFYFLQKLRKYGNLIFWNPEKVYPAARFSDRVYFGTGPAMIRGNKGDWTGYPLFPVGFFNEVKETYDLFPSFFRKTRNTKVVEFLSSHLAEVDPFGMIRANSKDPVQFVRACHEKFDGLRILQYLKSRQRKEPFGDEESLEEFLLRFYDAGETEKAGLKKNFSFQDATAEEMEQIRCFLAEQEEKCQVSSTLL